MQEIPCHQSSMNSQTVMLTKTLWHERQAHIQRMCPSCMMHVEKKVGQISPDWRGLRCEQLSRVWVASSRLYQGLSMNLCSMQFRLPVCQQLDQVRGEEACAIEPMHASISATVAPLFVHTLHGRGKGWLTCLGKPSSLTVVQHFFFRVLSSGPVTYFMKILSHRSIHMPHLWTSLSPVF